MTRHVRNVAWAVAVALVIALVASLVIDSLA